MKDKTRLRLFRGSMIMDHNESHFIDNIVFADQEYFHNNLGEWVFFFVSLTGLISLSNRSESPRSYFCLFNQINYIFRRPAEGWDESSNLRDWERRKTMYCDRRTY